ncbi:MAG TPA: hypothetical protein VIS94_13275 [Desulfomonilia bacterium]
MQEERFAKQYHPDLKIRHIAQFLKAPLVDHIGNEKALERVCNDKRVPLRRYLVAELMRAALRRFVVICRAWGSTRITYSGTSSSLIRYFFIPMV